MLSGRRRRRLPELQLPQDLRNLRRLKRVRVFSFFPLSPSRAKNVNFLREPSVRSPFTAGSAKTQRTRIGNGRASRPFRFPTAYGLRSAPVTRTPAAMPTALTHPARGPAPMPATRIDGVGFHQRRSHAGNEAGIYRRRSCCKADCTSGGEHKSDISHRRFSSIHSLKRKSSAARFVPATRSKIADNAST